MHSPTPPNILNNSNKVLNKPPHPIPTPPGRRLRPPSPPNVIPNNPKPPPKPLNNPIPNGGIVRIPMHQDQRDPINGPVLVDSQPHPITSNNPPSTHTPKVVVTPKTACAKLQPERAHVAQGIEHCPPEAGVAGSNPAVGAPFDQA
jgi:hypothetical protein